jgi:hypothetical protein
MNAIVSAKSDLALSVPLDQSSHKGILVCNGVTNMTVRATFVCVGVKLLPVPVAIAGRRMSQGDKLCCTDNTSPTPGFGV